jgi:hypothetical protein
VKGGGTIIGEVVVSKWNGGWGPVRELVVRLCYGSQTGMNLGNDSIMHSNMHETDKMTISTKEIHWRDKLLLPQ